MTADDFDAEEYRQQRRSRSWWSCDAVLLGAAVLMVLVVRTVRTKEQ